MMEEYGGGGIMQLLKWVKAKADRAKLAQKESSPMGQPQPMPGPVDNPMMGDADMTGEVVNPNLTAMLMGRRRDARMMNGKINPDRGWPSMMGQGFRRMGMGGGF